NLASGHGSVEHDQSAVVVDGERRSRRAVDGYGGIRLHGRAAAVWRIQGGHMAVVTDTIDDRPLPQLERVLPWLRYSENLVLGLIVQAIPVQEHAPSPAPVHVHLLDRRVLLLRDVHEWQGIEVPGLRPCRVALLPTATELDDGRAELRAALPAVPFARRDVGSQVFSHAFLSASRWRRAASAARCESLRRSAKTGLLNC